jgi:ATP-dependent helicase HrpB
MITEFLKQQTLPITDVLAPLQQHLLSCRQLVLEAPPGAGKTTLVPLALLDQPWLQLKRILMLEPRRMAARAAAFRMADLLGESVGQTVGYRIRQETKISKQTRIEVITEGILTRMLLQDPSLEGIAAIIFDECHERSMDGDLGLALALQSRELFRDEATPLRIILMSATLDSQGISQMLGEQQTPVLRSAGRMYPVDIIYGRAYRYDDNVVERIVKQLLQILDDETGSVLVFVPGQAEIRRCQQQLAPQLSTQQQATTVVMALYGALSLNEQQRAIAPLSDSRQRKVVFATDIAETSLTIQGISVVLDSGLRREPRFDPASGMTRLSTSRISKDSSIQRMGRAGRLSHGRCYRLWSEEQQKQLAQQSTPEILQADLSPLILQLLSWGIDDITELQWLDLPPKGAVSQALQLLNELGATEVKQQQSTDDIQYQQLGDWQISAHGEAMASMPTHPRLAHMLLRSLPIRAQPIAAGLAALLSDRSPLSDEHGADLSAQLAVVLGQSPCRKKHQGWLHRCQKQAKSFLQLLQKQSITAAGSKQTLNEDQQLAYLLACAYPDRIAVRKSEHSKQYQLSNGRIATLRETDSLSKQSWLVVAELGGRVGREGKKQDDIIYSACALEPILFEHALNDLVQQRDHMQWDDKSERFIAEQQDAIGKLIIGRRSIDKISSQQKRQALLALVTKRGLNILPWTKAIRQWQGRVALLYHVHNSDSAENLWPDLSDSRLLRTVEQWLGPYLDPVNKLSDFKKLDLSTILANLLAWPLPQQLKEQAPLSIQVPSGSNIQIDYSENPPVLKVKLQEMFGCHNTPTIANGNIKLMVHLLSPAQRPLQVTQDLAGFWQSSYFEVKKDMKGRYPKHPWPDDPLQAIATKHTKKRSGHD